MLNVPQLPRAGQPLGPGALRIAMIAPPWFAIPPTGYGGTEAVIANLVEGLVAAGHHVSLIASGESGTSAQVFRQVFEVPPSEHVGEALPEVASAIEVE